MVLDEAKVLQKYKNPDPRIAAAKDEHRVLLVHVHGVGTAEHLDKIEGFENEKKFKLRKKFARSNRDFFAKLFRHIDKIFSAQGGSINYGLKDEKKRATLQALLYNIKDGISLDKWLENIWLDKLATDPNGIILFEHKDGIPYPTYKSILTIRDYVQNGQGVDYIIFEPYKIDEEVGEFVRVYDDEGDKTYLINGDEIKLLENSDAEQFNFPNPWGYVPAIICSDLIHPITGFRKSTIYEQIELAEEYLRDNSVKSIFKKLHGFPLFWMYAPACETCKGTGLTKDLKVCPVCNGSKHSVTRDVSDILLLKQPATNESPVIAPNIADFVSPDLDTWGKMTEEIQLLDDAMTYSHWGTVIRTEDVSKTATEVFVNAQPVEDRLNKYSDSLEIVEKYAIDIVGEYVFGETYTGTSFNAGRTYGVKGIAQLTKEYTDLKMAKVGQGELNAKLAELINAKYANDSFSLTVAKKLAAVEPFVHSTIEEVKAMGLDLLTYLRKCYYTEWTTTLDQDYIFKTDAAKLREELTTYVTSILTKMQENAKLQNGGGVTDDNA
jgi:RNA polymerase subunit RPABC4/transcription elongation factor Spt4